MNTIHLIAGITVLATNLGAASWGGVAWLRGQPAVGFWYLLRIAQAAVVVQAILGSVLLIGGREAADGLHYLYGLLPIGVSLLAEMARAGAGDRELAGIDFDALPKDRQLRIVSAITRRETGIMAVSAFVVFLLALRAAGTTPAI